MSLAEDAYDYLCRQEFESLAGLVSAAPAGNAAWINTPTAKIVPLLAITTKLQALVNSVAPARKTYWQNAVGSLGVTSVFLT